MLSYQLQEGPLPFYEQLYRLLRDDIHAGRLAPGEKLPSRRALAQQLGVSVITVDGAYAQLQAEGYLRAEERRGYYVVPFLEEQGRAGRAPVPPVMVRPAAPEGERPLLADFSSNETRSELFPFAVWSRLIREQLSMNQSDLLRNPPPEGRMDLRRAIAAHLSGFRGMRVEPEQIVIGAGTEYLYGMLAQLLGPERTYAVEDPGYRKPAQVYALHGAKVLHIPMDEKGILPEPLEELHADVVHTSPSHHYPTGIVMPLERRMELLRWAYAGNRFIIEDDHDSEFRMAGHPLPALRSMDQGARVIYLNTFTRTLASTIRISYMVLPTSLLALYHEKLSFYRCAVSSMEQATLAAFIGRGYFEKHLNRTRNSLRRKRDRLLRLMRELLPEGSCRVTGEEAGLHFLLTIDTACGDDEVCRRAEALGLRMLPLSRSYFSAEDRPQHCFIMNYASLKEETLGEVCAALAKLVAGVCDSSR